LRRQRQISVNKASYCVNFDPAISAAWRLAWEQDGMDSCARWRARRQRQRLNTKAKRLTKVLYCGTDLLCLANPESGLDFDYLSSY
jgi:hypothetical protein